MAYIHDLYEFPDSIEHEFKYAGKYGARGEPRSQKKKTTKEQIQKQNQRNRETRVRRLIKANFTDYDIWTCCKYPAGDRPDISEVRKDCSAFRSLLSKEYRKHGHELKYVYRLEVGARGGIHFHILVNRIPNGDTDVMLDKTWDRVLRNSFKRRGRPQGRTAGLIDTRSCYSSGGYERLANYICKQPSKDSKEYKQMSLFDNTTQKQLLAVQTSRNLIRPEPVRKEYAHWTMRKIVRDGPKPKPGYYIPPETVHIGVNPYNGWSYCHYTEIKLRI